MMARMQLARRTSMQDMPPKILLMICTFLPLDLSLGVSKTDTHVYYPMYRPTQLLSPCRRMADSSELLGWILL
ncbi:hypothetical protein BKA82DRAFT_541790 [Pisolithus tinctorius]|uniref:Uncharacterized protein n=1 Tax=Pisolithus tinctorius Marx 270 TaxID=870435 RepID=A0A0C3J791_PISTI|nr:hypothetical protein BKA82DRAFT_541790 [Pisolithus tinctorius]KIO04898.1 hypothetical protein M404DRAFT_541790 [Pisolithus tinctorius Marx 270]